MKLVVTRSGMRHLVADSAAHTLCGRDYGTWEDAPEARMGDVPTHRHCVACWNAADRSTESFRDETWSDGSPVLPLDFGKGGHISSDEAKRIRRVQSELERAEREGMRDARAN
jgi:hypothetical protein